MLEEIQLEEDSEVTTPDKIKKKWRAKVENKTLDPNDLINYFQLSASYFLTVTRKDNGSDIGELRLRLFYSHCSPTMSCILFQFKISLRQRESLDHRCRRSLHLSHSPFHFLFLA